MSAKQITMLTRNIIALIVVLGLPLSFIFNRSLPDYYIPILMLILGSYFEVTIDRFLRL